VVVLEVPVGRYWFQRSRDLSRREVGEVSLCGREPSACRPRNIACPKKFASARFPRSTRRAEDPATTYHRILTVSSMVLEALCCCSCNRTGGGNRCIFSIDARGSGVRRWFLWCLGDSGAPVFAFSLAVEAQIPQKTCSHQLARCSFVPADAALAVVHVLHALVHEAGKECFSRLRHGYLPDCNLRSGCVHLWCV
jgi:hypothetical protein